MRLCFIIPCFNEEHRLRLTTFEDFLNQNPLIHLLFVNDGSSDQTFSILEKFTQKFENASCMDLKINSGKAEAIRQGVLSLNSNEFDYIGFWDADLATPLTEMELFINEAKTSSYHAILGSRILRLGGHIHRKWQRHLLGRLFATIASALLKLPIYDTQCGAKLFSTKIVHEIFADRFMSKWLFDVEVLFRYKSSTSFDQDKIVEIPLRAWKDEHGSKLKIRDFLKAPYELFRIFFKYGY